MSNRIRDLYDLNRDMSQYSITINQLIQLIPPFFLQLNGHDMRDLCCAVLMRAQLSLSCTDPTSFDHRSTIASNSRHRNVNRPSRLRLAMSHLSVSDLNRHSSREAHKPVEGSLCTKPG